MSYGTIKFDKQDRPYIVLEFRRINPKTKEKFYKSKKVYLNEELTCAKLKKEAETIDIEFVKECEKEMKLGIDSSSMTYKEFSEMYLKYIEKNRAINTYSRLTQIAPLVVKELGHFKLKDITPDVVERFIEKINSLTKETKKCFAKKDFNKILEEKGYTYHFLRHEMEIQHFTLKKAMDGESITKRWAEEFSNAINIPFNNLFEIQTVKTEFAYNTKKKYIAYLKASLSYAVRKRLIETNYATSTYIEPIKNNEPNRKTKCMTRVEFYKLYDSIKNNKDLRIKNAIFLLLNTGMRKEELLGLKWENIFFNEKMIEIKNTIVYVPKVGIVFNESTKNASSTRIIAISSEVVNSLKEYKEYTESKIVKSDFLFTQDDGTNINPGTINYWLDKALDEAGLEHYTVHSIRHAYASLMIEDTSSIIAVSKRIGHSRVSTTTDIYGHVVSNNDREIANAIHNEKDSPIISYLKESLKNGAITVDFYNEAVKKL